VLARTAGLRVLPNPATGHVIVQVPVLPGNGAVPATLTLLNALDRLDGVMHLGVN
jgi:hypothetical protein